MLPERVRCANANVYGRGLVSLITVAEPQYAREDLSYAGHLKDASQLLQALFEIPSGNVSARLCRACARGGVVAVSPG